MTQDIFITTAATYGMLAVVFGAFGAHALKKILNEDQLKSYEVGIKYQMYHAIVLLILGLNDQYIISGIFWCFAVGIFLFSFSIYGLVISSAKNRKLRFLGPITPLGGLLLVTGWLLLLINTIF